MYRSRNVTMQIIQPDPDICIYLLNGFIIILLDPFLNINDACLTIMDDDISESPKMGCDL